MEKCVLTLSWEDIESRIPAGRTLNDEQKQKLFDQVADLMDGNEPIMEAFWAVIEIGIDDFDSNAD